MLTFWSWPMTLIRAKARRRQQQNLTFKGELVQKLEWKQTDRRTDRQTQPIALPSRLTRSVKAD